MITGTKYINHDLFFTLFKKHYCPTCNKRLRLVKKSKIINSGSPEAANFDFSLADSFMKGNVRFVWKEFQCPACQTEYTIEDMKRRENGKR